MALFRPKTIHIEFEAHMLSERSSETRTAIYAFELSIIETMEAFGYGLYLTTGRLSGQTALDFRDKNQP